MANGLVKKRGSLFPPYASHAASLCTVVTANRTCANRLLFEPHAEVRSNLARFDVLPQRDLARETEKHGTTPMILLFCFLCSVLRICSVFSCLATEWLFFKINLSDREFEWQT